MFTAVLNFASLVEALRSCEHPLGSDLAGNNRGGKSRHPRYGRLRKLRAKPL